MFDFNTTSERPLSKLSKNHKINVIGPSELKLHVCAVSVMMFLSLLYRWSELTQRLELWVELMELSDQGEYIPVEMQSKPEVVTGGVFMIRQGQSRRINVAVRTVSGSGNSPLKADHIDYVSMGSIYLRNRYDEALDSYQSRDLERWACNDRAPLILPLVLLSVCMY